MARIHLSLPKNAYVIASAKLFAVPLLLGLLAPSPTFALCGDGSRPQPCPNLRSRSVCDLTLCPKDPLPYTDGNVTPKYLVLTVIYAAPGSKDCAIASTLKYSADSTLGSIVSSSHTSKTDANGGVTVTVGTAVTGNDGSFSVSVDHSDEHGNSSDADVKMTNSSGFSGSKSCRDGINHDDDQIYLLLGPELRVRIVDAPDGEQVSWTPVEGSMNGVQWVTVGQLKGLEPLSDGMTRAISDYGLDSGDFAEILNADPFANDPNGVPDPSRFARVEFNGSNGNVSTFAYEPSPNPDFMPGQMEVTLTRDQTDTSADNYEYDNSVGVKIEGSSGFGPIFSAKVNAELKWTWTYKSSVSISSEHKTTADFTIGVPSTDYTGPTQVAVYYDSIFNTFAFTTVE
jgi:hypothetical protein